jgi:hypothetical protein
MKSLILYHTLGCHLCDLAKEQIEPLLDVCDLRLVEIDIADDETLLQRYGVRIPVIRLAIEADNDEKGAEKGADLGWPFDTQAVYRWLLAQ